MTIHWDDADIPWRNIDSTKKDVLVLSQHNAPFNSERKRMNASSMLNNSKSDIKTIAESSTHIDIQERNELYTLLNKYECFLDNNLGTWLLSPMILNLNQMQNLWKTFPVPSTHELTFK